MAKENVLDIVSDDTIQKIKEQARKNALNREVQFKIRLSNVLLNTFPDRDDYHVINETGLIEYLGNKKKK